MTGPLIESDEAYTVSARCPACRVRTEVPVRLVTLLKQTVDKTVIHITLLQDTTLHRCGQLRIDDAIIDVEVVELPALPWVDPDTGEIRETTGAGR